jgi:acetyl esterase/lipase
VPVKFDLSAPYEVEESDLVYARADGKDLLARIYRPRGTPSALLPAIVDVHGGAWSRGDHTVGALHDHGLAACGLVVACLGFRQGPDHKHPAAAADVAAGVRWVRAHAQRLGVDGTRVGLVGASSGGQLALLVAVTPGAPEHSGTAIVRPDGSRAAGAGDESVSFVIALYPVADPLARYRYALGRLKEPPAPSGFNAQNLVNGHHAYFTDEAAMSAASVTRIVSSGQARALPPAWVAHPENDDNVPASITDAFVDAYAAAGGSIERVHFPGARHGFIQQAHPDSEKCIALMRDFIGRHLAAR